MEPTYTDPMAGGTSSDNLPRRVTPIYRPGMTQEQFQQALDADLTYQAILRDPANRMANGQMSPMGWSKANEYANRAGLTELNGASARERGVAGSFHRGSSTFVIGGDGKILESHDSAWNPATAGTLLTTAVGATIGGGLLSGAGGGGGAVPAGTTGAAMPAATGVEGLTATSLGLPTTAGLGTAGTTAAVGTGTGATLASTTLPTSTGTIAGSVPSGAVPAATSSPGILHTLGSVSRNAQNYTDLANTLTQGAQGSAEGRRRDTYADLSSADANNRALLGSAVFNRDLPSVQTSQVARGDLLSTMHDAAPTGDPRIDKFGGGGLRPSAFGPDTHQAGDALKRQALQNLLAGRGKLTPQLTTPREPGFGENAMGYTGTALNILGTIGRLYR